jgi:hypothetical protein
VSEDRLEHERDVGIGRGIGIVAMPQVVGRIGRLGWAVGIAFSTLGLSCPRLHEPQRAGGPTLEAMAFAAAAPEPAFRPEPAPALAAIDPGPAPSVQEPAEPSSSPTDSETSEIESEQAPDAGLAQPGATEPEGPVLGAILKETWVYSKPGFKSRRLGYLRAGAVVGRSEKPAGYSGCQQGWYRVTPRGFVCVGLGATIEATHPVLEASAVRADRHRGLPYTYVMSRTPPPPLYLRLPSEQQQQQVEPELRSRKPSHAASDLPQLGEVPGALLYGRPLPTIQGPPHSRDALVSSRPVPRSGFALLNAFEWNERPFGLTTDMNVIPLDRVRPVKASGFRGIALSDEGLPAAFVRSRNARKYRLVAASHTMADAGPVAYREGAALTGRQIRSGGEIFYEGRDSTWLREKDSWVVIPPIQNAPGWAAQGRKWIDVSILRQTLVAYEGTRPVYATLVSTGADGLGDPKKTHSTIQGVFLIHTKHVAVTMDGDDVGDEFDLRDVPYVQYFTEGYALHGAYWHDEFGTPRSHGCVNLAPDDAAWLFGWTDPQVPEAWHATLQPRGGAVVYIHP